MKKMFLLIILPTLLFCGELRLYTFDYPVFATSDEDNQLNLWDFGENPSWIAIDKKMGWNDLRMLGGKTGGDRIKPYDPKEMTNFHLTHDMVRLLTPKDVVVCELGYQSSRERNIGNTIERYPERDAFSFTDTTFGNRTFRGPSLSIGYSRKGKYINIGALFSHTLEHGLKNEYTRPENFVRNFGVNIGFSFNLADNLAIGVNFASSDFQEIVETDGDAVIYRDVIGRTERIVAGSGFERKTKDAGYSLGFQSTYRFGLFNLAFLSEYLLSNVEIMDNFSHPEDIVYWQEEGHRIKGILTLSPIPSLLLGSYISSLKIGNWSEHPEYHSLISEIDSAEVTYGGGVRWDRGNFTIGAEYFTGNVCISGEEYIGAGHIERARREDVFRVCGEYYVIKSLPVRLGYSQRTGIVDRVFYGVGIGYRRDKIEFNLGGLYGLKETEEIQARRRDLKFFVGMRIFI